MKLKSLAIMTLLILGCGLGSAQTFGFLSTGGGQFCDYEVLKPYAGAIWQGSDVLSTCGLNRNATIVGVSASLSATENPLGFALKGVACADNIFDAYAGEYTGEQWFRITNLKASSKKYGWIGFAGISGFVFGDSYGYLTTTIPDENNLTTKRLSTGQRLK